MSRKHARAIITIQFCLLGLIVLCADTAGQEPAGTGIEFKVVETPQKMTPRRPRPNREDPVLGERFVVVVRSAKSRLGLNLNSVLAADSSKGDSPSPKLREFLRAELGRRVLHIADGISRSDRAPMKSRDIWQAKGNGPHPYGVRISGAALPEARLKPVTHEFYILAPSPERARELATVLVQGCRSYVQRTRDALEKELQELQEQLPAQVKAESKLEAQGVELSKKLEQFEESELIDQKAAEDLTTRKYAIKVAIAGEEARLKAAKKVSKRPQDRQVAEEIKVRAEVELASLLAQRAVVNILLKDYLAYKKLRGAQKHEEAELRVVQGRKRALERGIAQLKEEVACFVPFELAGPVVIRPIEWTPKRIVRPPSRR